VLSAPQKPPSLRELDLNHYVKHYLGLLWRWKLWIIFTGPIVSLGILMYMVKLAPPKPELAATALIGVENVSNMVSFMAVENVDNSNAEIIQTRNFLKDIVIRLSLQFGLKQYSRAEIFDSIVLDTTALPGRYAFTIDKDNSDRYMVIYYGNRLLGLKKRVVESGKLSMLNNISLPGTRLVFKNGFLKNPHDFAFSIASMPKAIEYLYANIAVKKPDMRQQRNFIEVSLTGRDYPLIATIINTIADEFVLKKLMFRKRKAQNALSILEKQYEKADVELEQSEKGLRNFRTSNPTVGLTQSAQQTVTTLSELETNSFMIKSTLADAQNLQSKFNLATGDDKPQTAEEVHVFLISQGNTSAPVLQMEMNRLLAEKRALLTNYMENHPLVQKNKADVQNVIDKTSVALSNFIATMEKKIEGNALSIQAMSGKLHALPSKELEMAELQRQHGVNAQIHSTVMDRYNQAKVAETVEVADAYVMDYATPPIPPPADLLKLLAICLLAGLAMSFAPPIVTDMLSKTVRTEFELQKMTDMVVLESIPEISPVKRSGKR